MTADQALEFLKGGGAWGVLILALWGGARQWWVFGWSYRKLEMERDIWRELALTGASTAEQAVNLAKRDALR